MRRTQLGFAAAALTAALIAPSAALGAIRHVDKTGADNVTCSAAAPCLTINHAVSVAGVADTIRIGPGAYDEAVVADQRLHFEGAGAGDPTSLVTPGTTRIQPILDDGPAIEMRDGGTVRDLQLVGKANPSPTNRPGLLLTTAGGGGALAYVVEHVNAFGGETGGGTRKESIRIDDDGTGRDITTNLQDMVIAPGATNDGSDGLIVDGQDAVAELDRVTIRPLSNQVRFPLWTQNGGRLELSETRMLPTGKVNSGILIDDAPGGAIIDRSDLRADGPVLQVSNSTAGLSFVTVRNSVLAGVSADPVDPSTIPTVTASNQSTGDVILGLVGTTVLSRRADGEAVVDASSGSGDARIDIGNSIVRATNTTGTPAPDIHVHPGNGEARVDASGSNFSEVVLEAPFGAGSGTVPALGQDGNLGGDPGFVNEAGGDFRLGATSPLVDRGVPGVVSGTVDLLGGPRVIDGDGDGVATPDPGAFERNFIPPGGGGGGDNGDGGGEGGGSGEGAAATAVPGGSTGASTSTAVRILRFGVSQRRFRVSGKPTALAARSRRTKVGSAFRFALSAPATASIAITRKQPGTRRGRRCGKPKRGGKRCKRTVVVGTLTRKAGEGATSIPFSGRLGRRALRPGSYKATLVATGTDGTRSKASTVSFRVVRR